LFLKIKFLSFLEMPKKGAKIYTIKMQTAQLLASFLSAKNPYNWPIHHTLAASIIHNYSFFFYNARNIRRRVLLWFHHTSIWIYIRRLPQVNICFHKQPIYWFAKHTIHNKYHCKNTYIQKCIICSYLYCLSLCNGFELWKIW